jgi:hypothetical protein
VARLQVATFIVDTICETFKKKVGSIDVVQVVTNNATIDKKSARRIIIEDKYPHYL